MDIDFDVTVEFGIIDEVDPERSYLLQDEAFSEEAMARAASEYNCISIPYDIFVEIYPHTSEVQTYFGSLKRRFRGLDPYGVTLIPPESCQEIGDILYRNIDMFSHRESVENLIELLDCASECCRYAIFYGV